MSIDLVISDKGEVLLASNAPFAGDVSRIDFHPEKRLLLLQFVSGNIESELLNIEVHERLLTPLLKASVAILAQYQDGKPIQGYRVPIVQAEFPL